MQISNISLITAHSKSFVLDQSNHHLNHTSMCSKYKSTNAINTGLYKSNSSNTRVKSNADFSIPVKLIQTTI